MPLSHLLRPVAVGGVRLRNRVAMAPMTRARSPPVPPAQCGLANERQAEYYAQRASAGLIVTEGTFPCPAGIGWAHVPGVYTAQHAEAWRPVTQRVHDAGGRIVCQLWHMGRQGHSSYQEGGAAPTAPSPIAIRISLKGGVYGADFKKHPHEVPRELTTEEAAALPAAYAGAALTAKAGGFDGVEIHSANGYLLDTFLQSSTNRRCDRYGGGKEGRFTLLGEVVEAVQAAWPDGIVGVRHSPNGIYGDMGSEDNHEAFLWYAGQLSALGISYYHVMDGLDFGAHDKCAYVTLAEVRREFKGVIMGNCGYTAEKADAAIAAGDADMISFARPYLANPDLVERFANGWPLADVPDPKVWHGPHGPKGWQGGEWYTDFPVYQS